MNAAEVHEYLCFETPIGRLVLAATGVGVSLVEFLGPGKPDRPEVEAIILKRLPGARVRPAAGTGLVETVRLQILDYLIDRIPLPAVALDVEAGSDFDRRVWSALRTIPFGQTRTYAQAASAATGNPRAARAAGGACGRNPVPLIVPCHRVVAGGGGLGGFSGGLSIKRALLELEGCRMPPDRLEVQT